MLYLYLIQEYLLYCTLQILFILLIEDKWQVCVKQVTGSIFSNNISSFHVCMLHFGNPHQIIIVLIMVICDP